MAKKLNYAELFVLRKDGRYMARYTDETGRHALYDRDPERLYARLQEAKLPKEERIPTFRDIAENWERQHREEITVRTWKNYAPHYQDILTKHGKKHIEDVSAADVQNHLLEAKAKQYSATVVNAIRSMYRMIFDYAIIAGHAKYNPVTAIKLPRGLKRGKRTAPTDEQIQIIFNNIDKPFGLFPFFLLCTGLRKSEALALNWSDVDFQKKEISVTKSLDYDIGAKPKEKAPKSAAGVRIVPIVDVLAEPLQKARSAAVSPYLFPATDSNRSGKGGGYMTLRGYEEAWLRYCKEVGFVYWDEEQKKYKPTITAHNLRHGTATLMFESDVDVLTTKNILGHSRVEVTQEIYTELREAQNRKSVDKFNVSLTKFAEK